MAVQFGVPPCRMPGVHYRTSKQPAAWLRLQRARLHDSPPLKLKYMAIHRLPLFQSSRTHHRRQQDRKRARRADSGAGANVRYAIVTRGVTFVVSSAVVDGRQAARVAGAPLPEWRDWFDLVVVPARLPPVVRAVLNESLVGRSLSPRAGGAACRRRSVLPRYPRRYGSPHSLRCRRFGIR